MIMKITISNKTTDKKPTKEEAKNFFSNRTFKFQTVECSEADIKTIIESGYVITYLFNDNQFSRANNYMKANYKGTQFICIDVDKSDKTAEELIDMMEYKPTFYHTTLSHKKENKEFLNCYHFYYVLDKVVENEGNFNTLFSAFSKGIESYVDELAKDCHRCIYTANKNDSDYEYRYLGNIYNPDNILSATTNTVISFGEFVKSSTSNCLKIEFTNKSTTYTDLLETSEIRQQTTNDVKRFHNEFNLDGEFFNDLNSMSRGDFITKYCGIYQYLTKTPITKDMFNNGYADLRGYDYYEVPSAQYTWNAQLGKGQIKKVENGHRDNVLWLDAVAFMHIIPNITKEHLVYCLVREVYENFMNGDKEFTNYRIIEKAKQVWNNIDNISFKPIKKNYKIDNLYWLNRGVQPREAVALVRKLIKDTDIADLYEPTMTIEQNIEEFKLYGVKCTKKRLIEWCEENNINYITNKDYRNSMILYYYREDTTRSSRDIAKLLRENNNIRAGKDTVLSVIKNSLLSENEIF